MGTTQAAHANLGDIRGAHGIGRLRDRVAGRRASPDTRIRNGQDEDMTGPGRVVLERVIRIAPFGLGLWDLAAGGLVAEGMEVRVFPLANGRSLSGATAHANRRGVFVAQGIQGLRDFEAGEGVADDWMSAESPAQAFVVEVRDALGRFTPFVMHV